MLSRKNKELLLDLLFHQQMQSNEKLQKYMYYLKPWKYSVPNYKMSYLDNIVSMGEIQKTF
jgi:hypothetical protein